MNKVKENKNTSAKYICVAPSKEVFNINGKSLGFDPERALYYAYDIGRHRVYRSAYPKEPNYFDGKDINKTLRLFKYKSLKKAQQLCDEINAAYNDDFKPVLIED